MIIKRLGRFLKGKTIVFTKKQKKLFSELFVFISK